MKWSQSPLQLCPVPYLAHQLITDCLIVGLCVYLCSVIHLFFFSSICGLFYFIMSQIKQNYEEYFSVSLHACYWKRKTKEKKKTKNYKQALNVSRRASPKLTVTC